MAQSPLLHSNQGRISRFGLNGIILCVNVILVFFFFDLDMFNKPICWINNKKYIYSFFKYGCSINLNVGLVITSTYIFSSRHVQLT